jgi:uncharacterized membrane protein YhaH (DUF805 family)
MNYYTDAITSKYADFSGRARRREYWTFVVLHVAAYFVLFIVDIVIGTLYIFWGLYFVATIVPTLALAVRRLHDTGRSGWWYLLNFVPIASLAVLIFLLMDSQPGPNQYGSNPKGIGNPVSPLPTASRLEHLETLLRTEMITRVEYDERRRAILAEV